MNITLRFQGIDSERVERMEARLKEDILREAECYGGAIMVIHEMDDGQIFDVWERVNFEAVQTPLEVYRGLEAEGLPIKFARVPITDGRAPKSKDFDTLAMNITSASKDTAFIFNCQVEFPIHYEVGFMHLCKHDLKPVQILDILSKTF